MTIPLIRNLAITYLNLTALTPDKRNARKHPKKQIRALIRSIERFGWTVPILIDDNCNIIAGHARLEAAKLLKLSEVPVIRIADMTDEQRRAYMLADNRLAELATWDEPLLVDELEALLASGFDLSITGFDTADVDRVLGTAARVPVEEQVELPAPGTPIVSRLGDFWMIGDHFLLCGDARDPDAYAQLMQRERAQMVFTDPPYNVASAGNVSGLGAKVHREFVMGAGEMSRAEFEGLLRASMKCMAAVSVEGAIHFVCMDWRHVGEVLTAAEGVYSEQKNLCVWAKTNAGMGAFYRSQHELVFVFKVGTAEHVNNFGLGSKGRYRTNVWTYAGANTFREGRAEDLAAHPTVKPVAMIADAILDCSHRGSIILDPFAGSGTTLLAAEQTGRRGYGIELDPAYVDLCVRRLEQATGLEAIHEDGDSFAQHAQRRFNEREAA